MAKDQNGAISEFEATLIEAEENLVADFQFALNWLMNDKKVSRSQLAARLDVSKARVTQLLNGAANPTIRTAARYLRALGEIPEINTARLSELKSAEAWNPSDVWSDYLSECDTEREKHVREYSADQVRNLRRTMEAIKSNRTSFHNDNEIDWHTTDSANELVAIQ